MNFFTLSYLLLWLVVAFESLVLVLVLRELGVLYLGRRESFERDGPQEGRPLPNLEARGYDGSLRTLRDLPGEYRALLFGAGNCTLCRPAFEKFTRWSSRVTGLTTVMLMEGQAGATGSGPSENPDKRVWWIRDGDAMKSFGVRVSPFAVIVDARGIVTAKGLVNHHADVKRLVREARAKSALRPSARQQTNGAVAAPAAAQSPN